MHHLGVSSNDGRCSLPCQALPPLTGLPHATAIAKSSLLPHKTHPCLAITLLAHKKKAQYLLRVWHAGSTRRLAVLSTWLLQPDRHTP
jgi:hypothetical protein